MNESIFKAYDIRGVYPDQIDEEAAWRIGHATARFLQSKLEGYARGQTKSQSIVVGRDMRAHSPSLAQALIEGMTALGANVIDIGMIDTPQIYFAINHLGACGGVQVTASHNPPQYNGCKISGQRATPVGEDTGLRDIKHIAMAMASRISSGSTGQIVAENLTEPYKRHVRNFLNSNPKPLKIVIDASNGMAGKWVPLLFDDLALDIIPMNFEHDGSFVHDPNPLVEENLSSLKAEVVAKKADIGICFDGDADRLIVIDENGQSIGCDILTALLAQYFLQKHPGSTIVYDLRSSRAVKETVESLGGVARRERVGHAFMKKVLKESNAVFGGELSGHFYYRDNFFADSGMLTLVHLLNIFSATDQKMSELIEPLETYSSSGEINFEIEDKEGVMRQMAEKFHDGQTDYLDGVTVQYDKWWFNCRASNTEPLLRLTVEAENDDMLQSKMDELMAMLGEPAAH
jgi:phosphomannomutase